MRNDQNWKKSKLYIARFMMSLKMGIISSNNPWVDSYIETLDFGSMNTEKFLEQLELVRQSMHVDNKDSREISIPYDILTMLWGIEKHDKFLTIVTGKGSEYWNKRQNEIKKELNVIW